jgi:hypothetical protein
MTKRLAGKRWFEALGRRERSKGLPGWTGGYRHEWPNWAKWAYHDGWYDQGLLNPPAPYPAPYDNQPRH